MQHRAWAAGLLALGIGTPLLAAAPASAAPKWHIELFHRNLYAAHCTAADLTELEAGKSIAEVRHKEELEGETNRCGLDPFTNSATTLDRASGQNIYFVTVKNEGTAVKEGSPVTVGGHLPEGLRSAPPEIRTEGWSCAFAEKAAKFSCTTTHSLLEPGKAYPAIGIRNVYVPPTASSGVAAEATVTGGEAPEGASALDPTSFAPIPPGIDQFEQKACAEPLPANGECTLETQAGGHPVALLTNLLFKFIPGLVENQLRMAGGGNGALGAKEIETQLPPGLIGDVQSMQRCPIAQFESVVKGCPPGSEIGYIEASFNGEVRDGLAEPFCEPLFSVMGSGSHVCGSEAGVIYNLEPAFGHPAEFGFQLLANGVPGAGLPFVLYAKVRSDGDYGATVFDEATGPNTGVKAVFCSYGVHKNTSNPSVQVEECAPRTNGRTPFLTNPTQCSEAPVSTVRANLWSEPSTVLSQSYQLPTPTGCSALHFNPSLEFAPTPSEGTTQADEPSGMTFTLKVPEAIPSCKEVGGKPECPPSEPELKDLTVAFPEGVTVSPANADGLEVCSDAQFGLGTEFGPGVSKPTEPAREAKCPTGSQIGTLEVVSPLVPPEPDGSPHPLKGELYVAEPECGICTEAQAQSGQLFRLFLQLRDSRTGVIVKLHGSASVNPVTGRLTSTFDNQPQLPFEKLVLHMKGGPRAPLVTPQTCGVATTTSDLTPWSAPETADATPSSSFNVDANGAGVACPAAWPFFSPPSPNALLAGSTYVGAGEYSPFSLTLSREDRETNIKELTVHMPPGLTAKLAGVPLCPEAAATAGTCSPESQIGSASVLVGAGPHPYSQQGQIYLTGPYKSPSTGAEGPFGLSIVTPTKAGPFTLAGNTGRGLEVVRSVIEVNPETAAVSVVSDPLPQVVDGVPLRLRKVHVEITRSEFERNPTNCTEQQISASLTSTAGQQATVPARFEVGACGALSYGPSFSASTEAKTSRQNGASLTVKVAQKPGESNIKQTLLQLPAELPSRLTTLQHACTEAQFAKEPKGCPSQSFVGTATAHTPLLSVPLSGPAILVSHGGAAFPDVVFLLEGDGIHITLVGHTNIKNGITYSRFEAVPDQPISSFEVTLPEGSHSALAANGNLCQESLMMPTTLIAQDGAQRIQTTKVNVTGCPRITNAQKRKAALRACRRKDKHHKKLRLACERKARRRYPVTASKASKSNRIATALTSPLTHATSEAARAITTTTTSLSVSAPAAASPPTKAQEGACPNQAVIEESNENPSTHKPYSQGLPECRAYEMVSPLEKQGLGAYAQNLPVSPNGEAVEYRSEGDFGEPQGFAFEGLSSINEYLGRRGPAGWETQSSLPPTPLIETKPEIDHGSGLGVAEASCGAAREGGYACAYRRENGEWTKVAGPYQNDHQSSEAGEPIEAGTLQQTYKGSSADLSRVVFQPESSGRAMHLLRSDTLNGREAGIYEVSGLGGAHPKLSLVSIDNEGHALQEQGPEGSLSPALGGTHSPPTELNRSAYHGISENGERVFFGAAPKTTNQPTVYARVLCTSGSTCSEENEEGTRVECTGAHSPCPEGRETISVSEPECESICAHAEPKPAIFQGASADGSKVFFTTEQELLPTDKDQHSDPEHHDEGNDLYEYNFAAPIGHRLTLLSLGASGDGHPGEGADVQGVVRTSSDGSHVYFVATGVLTTNRNGNGEEAQEGADNLYAVDTTSGELKFVARLAQSDNGLWELTASSTNKVENYAQTTPDGSYLVFSAHAQLVTKDHCTVQQAYRYDFTSGGLIWLSHAASASILPSYCESAHASEEGQPSRITAPPVESRGAFADANDFDRAISESGEDVIFMTSEALQAGDVNHATDVYLWHCESPCTGEGTVSLISDGHAEEGIKSTKSRAGGGPPAISASGNDIFFFTAAPLVGQDKDELYDLYDARIGGGFPREAPPASCSGDGCQAPASLLPEFSAPGSSFFTGGHNLSATTVVPAPVPAGAVKHVTKRHKPSTKHNKRKRKGH
jgi:hypothetical protein